MIMLRLLSSLRVAHNILLRILPFALHTSPMLVEVLQSRSCLSYASYAITAA
jgi:hypothetical protein